MHKTDPKTSARNFDLYFKHILLVYDFKFTLITW